MSVEPLRDISGAVPVHLGRDVAGLSIAPQPGHAEQSSIKAHPIHPMLIVYPFAFLTGAFGFTAAAAALKKQDLRDVGRHLVPAGIVAGVAAAVPGVIDYLTVVPPQSSGQERARKHALLNVTGLLS